MALDWLPTSHPSRRGFLAGLGTAAVGLTFGGLAGCHKSGPSLNFYNWDTYIGATTLKDFKAATGVTVDLATGKGTAGMADSMPM